MNSSENKNSEKKKTTHILASWRDFPSAVPNVLPTGEVHHIVNLTPDFNDIHSEESHLKSQRRHLQSCLQYHDHLCDNGCSDIYILQYSSIAASPFKNTSQAASSSSSRRDFKIDQSCPTGWPTLDGMFNGLGIPSHAVVEITGEIYVCSTVVE